MNADEIVKALKQCAQDNNCLYPMTCPFACDDDGCMTDMMKAAADLIESLTTQLAESQRREKAAVEMLDGIEDCLICMPNGAGCNDCGPCYRTRRGVGEGEKV